MPCIYDLDNEYGGRIITDASAVNALELKSSGTGPALIATSLTAGQPAIAVYSTVSSSPIDIKEITVGGGGALFRSTVTYATAVTIGKTVKGNMTTAPLVFSNLSQASVPLIDFGNNFVSCTSIQLSAEAMKVVIVRAGAINYAIPLISLTSLVGAGAYA
jgi:hypothetical protein